MATKVKIGIGAALAALAVLLPATYLIAIIYPTNRADKNSAREAPSNDTVIIDPKSKKPNPGKLDLIKEKPPADAEEMFFYRLAIAASGITDRDVVYDTSYIQLEYPGGDVPAGRGVCTDLVIRAYRQIGIDLQVDVHEDMTANFDLYPTSFGLSGPDPNIDHRRVPNLMTFFSRRGKVLPVTDDFRDYRPGDIVTCEFVGGLTHIGIVSAYRIRGTDRFLVVHNGGYGQVLEDTLVRWKLTGHYRYRGDSGSGGLH